MNKETQMMLVPQGSIEGYIRAANEYPMLTAEEEKSLAERLYYDGDIEAAKKLVLSHLRFVIHVARGYSGYGLPQADLIQEGNIGLMKAVKRFNPEVGVRLVSFAVHWIKAEIHEYVLRNWRIVKVATSKEDVIEMESRMTGADVGFDLPTDDDDEAYVPSLYLEDKSSNFAAEFESENFEEQATEKLGTALANLDERSQEIIKARWLDDEKATLHDLAAKYNVSAERIRQLEANALKKLKSAVDF